MNNSSTKIYSQNREGKNINTAKKMLHPNLHPSPPKCSFQIPTALMSSVSFCTSLSFVKICFFLLFSKRKRQTHSNFDKGPTQFNFPASLLSEEKN